MAELIVLKIGHGEIILQSLENYSCHVINLYWPHAV